MEKSYCCNQYESKDEKLIARIKISDYMYNISKEYSNDKQLRNEWKIYYKNICNDIRISWNIERIISISYLPKRESVIVFEFPIKANNITYIEKVKWDEKVKKYYLEV